MPPTEENADSNGANEIPLATQRAYDRLKKAFSDHLKRIALVKMKRRSSSTLTDADLEEAYRELIHQNTPAIMRRVIGDGALFVGGVLVPLWSSSPILTFVGLFLAFIGLYVRELIR